MINRDFYKYNLHFRAVEITEDEENKRISADMSDIINPNKNVTAMTLRHYFL